MAVGIEPQAMPEARFLSKMLFGHAVQVVEEPTVHFLQVPQDLEERQVPFLFRHLRIEGIDAAELDVSRRSASGENERQILQRLLLPGGHVRKNIFDRPLAQDTMLGELCLGQASVGLLECCPGLLQFLKHLLFLHDSAIASFRVMMGSERGIIPPIALEWLAQKVSVFPQGPACSPIHRPAVLSSVRRPVGGRRRRDGTQRPARALR
jgi:hypothetical protein